MKKIFLPAIISLLSLSFCSYSQTPELNLKAQANDMAKAVLAKDVNKLANYLPPKLIADAGGKAKILVARDTLNKMMKQYGAEIKKVTIGNPGKIMPYKNQLQAIVPQTTEVSFFASTVIMESTLVAVSSDKGLHWYFVDTSIYRGEKLKSALPDLNPALVIPPMKQPKFVPSQ